MSVVGVISDTHGLLRSEAVAALQGCVLIVHAGDIGRSEVLKGLRAAAPLVAVRGNVDGSWAGDLPETAEVTVAGRRFYVLHNLAELGFDPGAAAFDVVISGHSHRPCIETDDGVLYVNPGSAGPRRFRLPVTIARIEIGSRGIEARILDVAPFLKRIAPHSCGV